MAEVTRDEFELLKSRVKYIETEMGIGDPVEPPAPVDPEVPLKAYLLAITDRSIMIRWTNNSKKTISANMYGRDGKDDTGAGPWMSPWLENIVNNTVTFDKLLPDTIYGLTVKAKYTDGTEEISLLTISTSKAPVVPQPPVNGGTVLTGLSGLKGNFTIFNGDSTTVAAMKNYGSQLGLPSLDGGLSFISRATWTSFQNNGLAANIKAVLDAGGIFILSMPHAPESEGVAMNLRGSLNQYKADQVKWATWAASKGLNSSRLIIRLDWEFNGDWYFWSAKNGLAYLRDACRNFMDNVRSGGLTSVQFDSCSNMPSSGSSASWKDLWVGPGYWNIFSIDQYDAWPAVKSAANMAAKMADIHSLSGAQSEAGRLGAQWAIAECGNWHTPDGGYDNPIYWQQMFIQVKKSLANMAYWNLYNDAGAPANLYHDFAHNPKSVSEIKAQMGAIKV